MHFYFPISESNISTEVHANKSITEIVKLQIHKHRKRMFLFLRLSFPSYIVHAQKTTFTLPT